MSDADRQAWADLMRAAQAGDAVSYDRLLHQIVPFIRAVLRGRVPLEGLEDVVQDVLLTVHRVRDSYDPARPFPPWLAAIAHRRGIDAMRRHASGPARETLTLPPDLASALPEQERLDGEAAASRLRAAIDSLPPSQRAALRLTKLDELSVAEAAARTGQTQGAIKVNVHRGLTRLRQLLGHSE